MANDVVKREIVLGFGATINLISVATQLANTIKEWEGDAVARPAAISMLFLVLWAVSGVFYLTYSVMHYDSGDRNGDGIVLVTSNSLFLLLVMLIILFVLLINNAFLYLFFCIMCTCFF